MRRSREKSSANNFAQIVYAGPGRADPERSHGIQRLPEGAGRTHNHNRKRGQH